RRSPARGRRDAVLSDRQRRLRRRARGLPARRRRARGHAARDEPRARRPRAGPPGGALTRRHGPAAALRAHQHRRHAAREPHLRLLPRRRDRRDDQHLLQRVRRDRGRSRARTGLRDRRAGLPVRRHLQQRARRLARRPERRARLGARRRVDGALLRGRAAGARAGRALRPADLRGRRRARRLPAAPARQLAAVGHHHHLLRPRRDRAPAGDGAARRARRHAARSCAQPAPLIAQATARMKPMFRTRALAAAIAVVALAGCSDGDFSATCRAKGDRVDVSWTPLPDFASYRVYRVDGGETVPVGVTSNASLVDASVSLDEPRLYLVKPLNADGSDAEDYAAACGVTPSPRLEDEPDPVGALVCRPKDAKVDVSWSSETGSVRWRVLGGAGEDTLAFLAETEQPL